MSTERWIGNAVAIKEVRTITIASTWAAADTATVTINGKDMVLTCGTNIATTDVANALKEAYNGENFGAGNSDYTVSPQGGGAAIGEHAELTASVSGSVVTLTGDKAGKPFTVTVTETTAGTGTATGATVTAATGPNHWDNADNWDDGSVPIDADDIIFDSGDVDCLYGLSPAIQPTSFTRTKNYTGKIGLADINADNNSLKYHEYRTTSLTFDDNTATCTYTLEGSGGRTRINAGAGQSIFIVKGKTTRELADVPEILLLGTHASNEIDLQKGDVGVAYYGGEVSTVATVKMGWITSQSSDSDLIFGSGSTLTTITKNGGDLWLEDNVTTVTQTGDGETYINGTATCTTLTVRGGTCFYNSTGTLTTVTVSGTGTLDFSSDDRAKTVTNPVEIYGSTAQFIDPNKVVGSLVVDLNEAANTENLDLGTHIRLTRGAVA